MIFSVTLSTIVIAASAALIPVQGAPAPFTKVNGQDAQKLNAQFASFTASDTCTYDKPACVNNAFAQCVSGNWVLTTCPSDQICVALPLVNQQGTTVICDFESDALARMQAAGVDASLSGTNSSSAPSATTEVSQAATATSAGSDSTPGAADDDDDCDTDDDPTTLESTATSTATSTNPTSSSADDDCDTGDDDSGSESTLVPSIASTALISMYKRQAASLVSSIAGSSSSIPIPSFASFFSSISPVDATDPSGPTPTSSLNSLSTSSVSASLPSITASSTDDSDIATVTVLSTLFITVTFIPPTSTEAAFTSDAVPSVTSDSSLPAISGSPATIFFSTASVSSSSALSLSTSSVQSNPSISAVSISLDSIVSSLSTPVLGAASVAQPTTIFLNNPTFTGTFASSSSAIAVTSAVQTSLSAPSSSASIIILRPSSALSASSAALTSAPSVTGSVAPSINSSDIAFLLTATL